MNLGYGLFLLCIGGLALYAGKVPILGLFVALLGPEIFLLGLVVMAIGVSKALSTKKIAIVLMAASLSIASGFNTRLPEIFSDALGGVGSETQITSLLEGVVGQPIHVVTELPEISARRHQYGHAGPACYGDGCLVFQGFRTPYPWLEMDYWHENVMDVTLKAGFSKAVDGEAAPTLTVHQSKKGLISSIHIDLKSVNGKLLASYDGHYRQGFTHETDDGVRSDTDIHLAFEYLLHGNVLAGLTAYVVPLAPSYPLSSFLKKATHLDHPQGVNAGFSPGTPTSGDKPATVKVALEIVEEKTYDPVWILTETSNSNALKWSEIAWDRERDERCKTLIRPETKNVPLMQTWHLFVNDPTGRKKIGYPANAVCDPDVIWLIDYVAEKGRVVLSKYAIDGDLIYQVSFAKPSEPLGYAGNIMSPTLSTRDGYLQFEWWNTNQSGQDRHVKRAMKMRFREPVANLTQTSTR